MLDRIRKVFSKVPESGPQQDWGRRHGLAFEQIDGRLVWRGELGGGTLRLECAPSSRPYIEGQEILARLEVGVADLPPVMVMGRQLKKTLDQTVYDTFTDNLRTTVNLPALEELRWLSMFQEVGWSTMTKEFLQSCAVVAESRGQAQQWLGLPLERLLCQLLAVSESAPPLVMMLSKGRVYLRMQHCPQAPGTLDLVLAVLLAAGQSARQFAPHA